MAVILSAPASVPDLAVASWLDLVVTWEGHDGSVWTLSDPTTGVFLQMDGVEGLHFPQIAKYSSTSRAVPGRRGRGSQVTGRDVFWPIFIWADGSEAWLDLQRRFLDTIHPDKPGTWRVNAAGNERTLRLTAMFSDSYQYPVDPVRHGWASYPIALEPDQPYWEGSLVEAGPWQAPAAVPFIPDGDGPPLHISSASAFGSATMANPGDVPAWPTWIVEDDLSSIELGVGTALIEVPFDTDEGDVLRIDTDPRNPTATLNGVDVTVELGLQEYAAVPPGGSVGLHVEATGAGSIRSELRPLHFRAF